MPRILILTASMGEGHNTAARNVREALAAESGGTAEVLVADPYTRTNPLVNKLMQEGYAIAINRYPRAWKVVFEMLDRKGVVEGMEKSMLQALKKAIREIVREFHPDIMVSTYPIFSFLVAALRRRDPTMTMPLYTIITDSTRISSAWYRCPCEGCLVADEQTAEVLRGDGVAADKIHVLGFPLGLVFEKLAPVDAPREGPWKVLFFPGGGNTRAVEVVSHLAEIKNLDVTVVAGRRQAMWDRMRENGMPRRGELLGWTDKMPDLLASHHFFIGKAGGATVQEAIAAQIPLLVSHVVPGQEEGNISLIEQSGIGTLATGGTERPRDVILGALANDAVLWRAWRGNLARMKKPSASRAIAKFLLDRSPR